MTTSVSLPINFVTMRSFSLSRICLSLSILVASSGLLVAQSEMVCDPVGFNKIPCPTNSDTIVGVPLRAKGSQKATLSALPDTTTLPGSAILSVAGSPGWTAGAYAGTHFVKFTSGALDGSFYAVTANTADTLTIDLNGDNVGAVVATDTLLLAQYWTLNTLFPPADATTEPATTKIAIVASINTYTTGRRTELLLPDLVSSGTNLAPTQTFYIYSGVWRKQGDAVNDYGSTRIQPDSYFIVRHTSKVTASTTYLCLGEVEMGNFAIPLSTQSTTGLNTRQDNFVAVPRPINVTLSQLGLVPGTFVASTSPYTPGRKDELLVFNNASQAFNKSASATYYYFNNAWRKQGASFTLDFGTDVIPAGAGFLVRKAPTVGGVTSFWVNPATYP